MRCPEHESPVDVLGGGEAGRQHPDRRQHEQDQQRVDDEPGPVHQYNHHRPHTALGNFPPVTRCSNVPEQDT